VGPGAIVIIGSDRQSFNVSTKAGSEDEIVFSEPFSCVDILGRSVVERTIDRLLRADAEAVSVLVAADVANAVRSLAGKWDNVRFQAVPDVGLAIKRKLEKFSRAGIEHSIVVSADVYAETDLLDFFYFHKESRRSITRSFDREGPLDLWVVNCVEAQRADLPGLLGRKEGANSSYFVREYAKRLAHPRDLRQFATDVLQNRSAVRPSGREIKPGIWVEDGAEIHRRARVVAPAYIGRGSKVQQDALVTRCSNIEEDCSIDCGTVIEDSTILSNTHVGIWLDVCHAIAAGNLFLNLRRDVALEISDPAIIRINSSAKKTKEKNLCLMQWDDTPEIVPDTQQVVALQPLDTKPEKPPAPEAWQFGANPIQG
jgi:NDP-sugar pyrophosphorylase family protein